MILTEIFLEGLKKYRSQGTRRGGDPLRIKVRVADPAGNITIFVTTPVEREKYPAVARQLLARKDLKGEQVGFIEKFPESGETGNLWKQFWEKQEKSAPAEHGGSCTWKRTGWSRWFMWKAQTL